MKAIMIGHIAYNRDITDFGTKVSIGGSGFYSAIGASTTGYKNIGLVSSYGRDFNPGELSKLEIDLSGVYRDSNYRTTLFTIEQLVTGQRLFDVEWGSSCCIDFKKFPQLYQSASHIHLCTAPPEQQLRWIEYFRNLRRDLIISIDTFEAYALNHSDTTLEVIKKADLVFLNKEESDILDFEKVQKNKPHVLKLGAEGAIYKNRDVAIKCDTFDTVAIETTGAGDVLAGSFISRIANNEEVSTALQSAVFTASKSVHKFGVSHLLKNKVLSE